MNRYASFLLVTERFQRFENCVSVGALRLVGGLTVRDGRHDLLNWRLGKSVLLLGENFAYHVLNLLTTHCWHTSNIWCFRAMDIVQNSTGKKLGFIPPLLIQKLNDAPLLWIGNIKAYRKFARVFLSGHYHHMPSVAYWYSIS